MTFLRLTAFCLLLLSTIYVTDHSYEHKFSLAHIVAAVGYLLNVLLVVGDVAVER
jgi:hypothetical protein